MEDDALRDAVKCVIGTPEGQILLAYLKQFTGHDRDCFHADPRVHAYNAGRRSVTLEISRLLKPENP